MFKRKRGIFQKLVISYIVFSGLVIASFMLSLVFSAVWITGGAPEQISPYSVVGEDGNVKNVDTVTNLGGWIEELDDNYCVQNIYGDKRTETMQYTQAEIYKLISMEQGDDRDYIGFMNPVPGENRYYLCIYDGDVMQVQTTVMIDSGYTPIWFKRFVVLFICLFFLNCILVSAYLRRKIKKPLDELITGMKQVQEGEKEVSLKFRAEKEFENIRDAFNRMAEQLEQEKREKALLVERKNQMLLELSHDIKTPIATIKSYANALEAGLVPEDKVMLYYHTIDMKADRITKLSEDMFILLKMESADYRPKLEEMDLAELLRKICAEYYTEISDAGFTFSIYIPEEKCMGFVDPHLFSRVIGNLLQNAKKYNRTGKQIGLSLQMQENRWQIDVFDDGEDIPEELAVTLFDAFIRGDEARKSDGGTGLGLAISKAIVEKHGGTIEYLREKDNNYFRILLG